MVSGAGQTQPDIAKAPHPIPRDDALRDELVGELEQAQKNIDHHGEQLARSQRIARGCRAALDAMADGQPDRGFPEPQDRIG